MNQYVVLYKTNLHMNSSRNFSQVTRQKKMKQSYLHCFKVIANLSWILKLSFDPENLKLILKKKTKNLKVLVWVYLWVLHMHDGSLPGYCALSMKRQGLEVNFREASIS